MVPLMVVSDSVTVKLKSFCLSLAVELITVLLTSREPVFRVFVNTTDAAASAGTLPVSPVLDTVKPAASDSVTVYLTVEGSLIAVTSCPPFRVKVATPFVNVISP